MIATNQFESIFGIGDRADTLRSYAALLRKNLSDVDLNSWQRESIAALLVEAADDVEDGQTWTDIRAFWTNVVWENMDDVGPTIATRVEEILENIFPN